MPPCNRVLATPLFGEAAASAPRSDALSVEPDSIRSRSALRLKGLAYDCQGTELLVGSDRRD